MSFDPIVHTPADDYELVDFGDRRKLERFGDYLVERPAPQASASPASGNWNPDWVYSGHRVAGGEWVARREGLSDQWQVRIDGQTVHIRLGEGGQVGVYPEHVACWRWVRERLAGCYHMEDIQVLNLFAGTGGATVAAVKAGASVTHVDAQKAQLDLAAANVGGEGARFIREDVMTFVERALRRGDRYDMIILDPPTFGRGTKKRVWDIKCDLTPLIRHLPRLITPECRGIWFSLHAEGWRAESLAQLLREALPGHTVESFELGTAAADGRALNAGVAAVWFDETGDLLVAEGGMPALDAAHIEERLDVYLDAVLSSRRTAERPAADLAAATRTQQDYVLHWTEIIARTNAEMAYQFAAHAPRALAAMDEAGMEAWIIRFMDVYDTSGLHPGIAALSDVEGFAREFSEKSHGAVFDEVVGVLEPFVHGLNGRKLKLETADEVYTDTDTLFLPTAITGLAEPRDNFRLYKAMAAHQWAQCWFGSFREPVTVHLAQYDRPGRALAVFHALEVLRLDACINRQLPGLYREMRMLCEQHGEAALPQSWQSWAGRLTAPGASVQDSLALLGEAYASGELPPRRCYQGRMDPERAERARSARLAREREAFGEVIARMSHEVGERRRAQGLDSAGSDLRFGAERIADEQMPDGFRMELQLDGQPVAPPPDVQALVTSIVQDLGEIPDEYLVAAGDGGYRPGRGPQDEDEGSDVWKGTYHEKGAHLYNEWDFKRRHYRKNWCVLREINVDPDSPLFVTRTLHRYSGLAKHIRRTFEALRGEDKLLKKQPHGDDIDIDAVVEAHAEVKSGMEMSDRLFTKLHKLERSIAVMFMVDMSGSTKGWINEAERESLVLLCEALEILGDRYAIYGFSGMTRKRCELYRVKHFDDPYSDEVKGRIGAIEPQDYTRMGVTIRHLTSLLEQVEARTKLLITLSDGKPDDYDGYRGEYGIEDTRMALIEAKRNGIHPFCITIDKEAHDYLPHMYGAVNYVVIDDVRKLPLRVSDIYRKLTT